MLWHQMRKLHQGQIEKSESKYRVAAIVSNQMLPCKLEGHIVRFDCQEVVRHLEKLGEVGEEGWPVPEEAWTRFASKNEYLKLQHVCVF